MKPILAFLKSRWQVVVCVALVLGVIPAGWYFSHHWNTKIRTDRENAAKGDLDKLKVRVAYAIPSLDPAVPAVAQSAEPNAIRTAFFKKHRDEVMAQGAGVVTAAEAFNRRAHAPLVDGFFPDARGQQAQLKADEFAEAIVGGTRGPSAYQKVFTSANGGEPTDAALLAQAVQDVRDREMEAIAGPNKRNLTPDEEAKLSKQLLARRIGEYQQRARTLSVYAGMDSLPTDRGEGMVGVPREKPKTTPTARECFAWQWDYWLINDLMDAVGAANTGPDGRPIGIDEAPVKRVVKISLNPTAAHEKQEEGFSGSGGAGEPTEAATPVTGIIEPKLNWSVTGRWDGPTNQLYDVRTARLTLIVDAERLPAIFDALARTNFMTVTDLDLSEVEVWSDLERGFYYGPRSVVQASIEVESIWLRSWTVPLMPADVRTALGVVVPERPAEPKAGEKKGPG